MWKWRYPPDQRAWSVRGLCQLGPHRQDCKGRAPAWILASVLLSDIKKDTRFSESLLLRKMAEVLCHCCELPLSCGEDFRWRGNEIMASPCWATAESLIRPVDSESGMLRSGWCGGEGSSLVANGIVVSIAFQKCSHRAHSFPSGLTKACSCRPEGLFPVFPPLGTISICGHRSYV